MKYMVMECFTSYAVVLSEDGQFIKVANMHYDVGQNVTDIVPMVEPDTPRQADTQKKTIRWPKIMAMAAAFVFMAAALLNILRTPYASVYMKINPEVRIDINKKDMVMGLAGVNADGESLIEGYSYKDKNLDTVMDEIVDRAISQGYLYRGGRISITLDGDSRWVESHSETVPQHLNEYLAEKMTVTIEVAGGQDTTGGVIVPINPDTDYGSSDYSPEVQTTPAPAADTDYGPGNDGVTDYSQRTDTDYGAGSDGVTDYSTPDDDGMTDYDHSKTEDNDSDSGYDD